MVRGCKNWGGEQYGLLYAGKKSETMDGTACLSWSNTVYRTLVGNNGKHSFCRNPDDDTGGPWCYTNKSPMTRDSCFEFFPAPSPLFNFDMLSGQFTVRANKFNYETQDSYVVVMTATEMNKANPLAVTKAVQITVININEAPVIPDQFLSVLENVPLDYPIGAKLGGIDVTGMFPTWVGAGTILNASDVDNTGTSPQGQRLAWRILAGDDERKFAFDYFTAGQLTVVNLLDYETATDRKHVLTVEVVDTGKGALTDQAKITIELRDVNEPPWWAQGINYDRSVTENEPTNAGIVGGPLLAKDVDVNDEAQLTYALLQQVPSSPGADPTDEKEQFQINANTGVVTVHPNADLNFEEYSKWNVVVQTTDGEFYATQTMRVTIIDINEAPVILAQFRNIIDNYQIGDNVGTPILASDQDNGALGYGDTLTFKMESGDTNNEFAMNGATGQLTVKVGPNADTLEDKVDDRGRSFGCPNCDKASYIYATTGLPCGNDVCVQDTNTKCTPIEAGIFQKVGCTCAANTKQKNGNCWTNDFLLAGIKNLVIRVTDDGDNRNGGVADLSTTANIIIQVDLANKPPNVDDTTRYVAENSKYGTSLGDPVEGTDPDQGQCRQPHRIENNDGSITYACEPDTTIDHYMINDAGERVIDPAGHVEGHEYGPVDKLTYAIVDGNTKGVHTHIFAVDPNTGSLTVNNTIGLNFEEKNIFYLRLRVTDDGNGNLQDSCIVTVVLTDVNEPPVVNNMVYEIQENANVGLVLGAAMTSSDVDAGDTRLYSIVKESDPDQVFRINPTTGIITVNMGAPATNYELQPDHVLTIRATDAGGEYGDGTAFVALKNGPDAPVLLPQTRKIPENSPEGFLVGTAIRGVDEDALDVLTYELLGGNCQSATPAKKDKEYLQSPLDTPGVLDLTFLAKSDADVSLTLATSDGSSPTPADRFTIRSSTGLYCLHHGWPLEGATSDPTDKDTGRTVDLWRCGAALEAQQMWNVDQTTGKIHLAVNPDYCLHVWNADVVIGSNQRIGLWPCASEYNVHQKWMFTSDGTLCLQKDGSFCARLSSTDNLKIDLNGVNDGSAKNLQRCSGECDSDSQCAAGLKCFQRSHNEPIPGCNNHPGGTLGNWDYCYDPNFDDLGASGVTIDLQRGPEQGQEVPAGFLLRTEVAAPSQMGAGGDKYEVEISDITTIKRCYSAPTESILTNGVDWVDSDKDGVADSWIVGGAGADFVGSSNQIRKSEICHNDVPVRAFKGNYQYVKRRDGTNEPAMFMQGAGGSVSLVVRSEGCNDAYKSGGCGYASIRLNGVEVARRGRGLNIVVVDPVMGRLMSSTSYDTYGDGNAQNRMADFLKAQQPGVIIAIAGQDEYTNQLTGSEPRKQLKAMGFSDKALYGTSVVESHFCAHEWHYCHCRGTVYYGRGRIGRHGDRSCTNLAYMRRHYGGNMRTRSVNGGIHCRNSRFGDPWRGVYKQCFCEQTNNRNKFRSSVANIAIKGGNVIAHEWNPRYSTSGDCTTVSKNFDLPNTGATVAIQGGVTYLLSLRLRGEATVTSAEPEKYNFAAMPAPGATKVQEYVRSFTAAKDSDSFGFKVSGTGNNIWSEFDSIKLVKYETSGEAICETVSTAPTHFNGAVVAPKNDKFSSYWLHSSRGQVMVGMGSRDTIFSGFWIKLISVSTGKPLTWQNHEVFQISDASGASDGITTIQFGSIINLEVAMLGLVDYSAETKQNFIDTRNGKDTLTKVSSSKTMMKVGGSNGVPGVIFEGSVITLEATKDGRALDICRNKGTFQGDTEPNFAGDTVHEFIVEMAPRPPTADTSARPEWSSQTLAVGVPAHLGGKRQIKSIPATFVGHTHIVTPEQTKDATLYFELDGPGYVYVAWSKNLARPLPGYGWTEVEDVDIIVSEAGKSDTTYKLSRKTFSQAGVVEVELTCDVATSCKTGNEMMIFLSGYGKPGHIISAIDRTESDYAPNFKYIAIGSNEGQATFDSVCLPSSLKKAILPNSKPNPITPPTSRALFSLNKNTGQVTLSVPALDFETSPTHNLLIALTDLSGIRIQTTLRIEITNVNEVPTLVDMCDTDPTSEACFTVKENSPTNTRIGFPLRVDDQDAMVEGITSIGLGSGHIISWSILGGNWGNVMKVGEFTGQLMVDQPTFDHESQIDYTLTMTATDNGVPALMVEAQVTVEVLDVNEAPIVATGREMKILECDDEPCSDGNTDLIGVVTAFDEDDSTQRYGQLSFSIDSVQGGKLNYGDDMAVPEWGELLNMKDTPTFTVRTITERDTSGIETTHARSKQYYAEIRFAAGASFDHEGDVNVYKLRLRASDAGAKITGSETRYDVEDVIVRLNDRNEAPSFNPFDLLVPEISLRRMLVGYPLVQGASDPDIYADQGLQFKIIGGNEDNIFAISLCEGQVKVETPLLAAAAGLTKGKIDMRKHATLDFESGKEWPLTIKVCDDHARQPLCVQGVTTIRMTDVNEAPYMRDSEWKVIENRAKGFEVGSVKPWWSEDDAVDRPKFYITDGNTIDSVYEINVDDGMIRVRNPILNFEKKMAGQNPYYNLEITVMDKENKRTQGRAMIRVQNINERPTAPSKTMRIPENPHGRIDVGDPVVGFDVDADHAHMSSNKNMRLKYALVADSQENAGRQYGNDLFSIEPETGQITMLDTIQKWPGCSPQSADIVSFKAQLGGGNWLGRKACKATCDRWLPSNANQETEQSQLVKLAKDQTQITLNTESVHIRVGQRVTVSDTGINPESAIQINTFVIAVNGDKVTIDKAAKFACTTTGGCDYRVRFHGCRQEVECQTYCITDQNNVWKNRLDYEANGGVITLVVRVTDADGAHSGANGNKGELLQDRDYDARVRIVLSNANERPIYYGGVRSIAEGSTTWTPVGSPVLAYDEDAQDTLTYWVDESVGMSVYGGTWIDTVDTLGMKAFDIHPLFAQVIVANPVLDYEIHGAIRLTVRAMDDSGFHDKAYITITLENQNEGPIWIGGERGFSPEKCPAGWNQLDGKYCCEQATGCTIKCAINEADAVTTTWSSTGSDTAFTQKVYEATGGITPSCADFAETTVMIERPAAWERRRGCAFFEDGTVNGACRVKADPVDHPNIGNGRACTMSPNKWCGSDTYYNNLKTRDVPNSESCGAWCKAQAFPEGAGCSYTKATGMCGIVLGCTTLLSTTTHSAAQCTMGDARKLTYKVLGGDPGRIFTLDPDRGVFTVRLPMFLDYENIKEFELAMRVTDSTGLTAEAQMSIRIDNVNETPEFVRGFGGRVKENAWTGQMFGEYAKGFDPDDVKIGPSIMDWWGSSTARSCVERPSRGSPHVRLANGCLEGYIEGMHRFPEVANWEWKIGTSEVASVGGDVDDEFHMYIEDQYVGFQNADENLVLPVRSSNQLTLKWKWAFKSSHRVGQKHQILTGAVESYATVNEARFLRYSINNGDGGNNGCCIASDGATGAPVSTDDLSKQCQNGRGKFGAGACKKNVFGITSSGRMYVSKRNQMNSAHKFAYDVTVRATDPGGLWDETNYHIEVLVANDPPTLTKRIATIKENSNNKIAYGGGRFGCQSTQECGGSHMGGCRPYPCYNDGSTTWNFANGVTPTEVGVASTTTYNQAKDKCYLMGGQLCSQAEICPRGSTYYGPLGKAEGGMRSSNMWVPTRDSYNAWVDVGNVGEADGSQDCTARDLGGAGNTIPCINQRHCRFHR